MSKKQQFGPWNVERGISCNCHTEKFIVTKQGEADRYVLYHLYDDRLPQFKNEVEIMKQLDHPNIIPLIDYDLDCETPYYVTDLYEKNLIRGMGALRIEQLKIESITPKLKQITKAIGFIHSQGILHNAIDHKKIILLRDGELYLRYFWRATRYTTHYLDTTGDMEAWIEKYNQFQIMAKRIHGEKTRKRKEEVQQAHGKAQPSAPARLSAE